MILHVRKNIQQTTNVSTNWRERTPFCGSENDTQSRELFRWDWKSLANFSWKGARDRVNLAWPLSKRSLLSFSRRLLWSYGWEDVPTILSTFQGVVRSFTIRVAERLAEYICSLMRNAATLAILETKHSVHLIGSARSCQNSLGQPPRLANCKG